MSSGSPFCQSLSPVRNRWLLLLTSALCLPLVWSAAEAQSGTFGDWNSNSTANWGDVTKWTAASPANTYPSGIGATAVVVQDVTSSRTINLLDSAGTSALDVTVGTLVLGDTNNSTSILIGTVTGGGTLTFDNAGAINGFGTTGALLDHQYRASTNGPATAADPFKQPNSGDRIDAQVILNDDLTVLASRSITFYNTWTGNGHDLTIGGLNTNRVYWYNNTTSQLGTLSGVDNLNILNGEVRFEGFSGAANSQLIGANTINFGDGFSTTAGNTSFDAFVRVFPRLYLVNTESTQTAHLNMNGGWLISDLGTLTPMNGDGMDIWSGTITLSGPATSNIFDVNDAGTPEVHYISGTIEGSGGFSKVNNGSLNLLADNTLSGDVYIQRGGPGGSAVTAKGSVTLSGATGALSQVTSIIISRDGSLYLDNSSATNNNRVNDSADILLRGQGRLRLTQQAGIAVSETFGDLRIDSGSGRVNFDFDASTPAAMSVSFASLTRDAGSISQFQVLDNIPGALGGAGNAHVYIADGGAGLLKKGGGGANGSTDQTLVVGVFGGSNNYADQFMTFDKANPTELRPLDLGTEYLTSRSLGHILSVATLTANDPTNPYNKNLNINYNVGDGYDPDVDWYGDRPVRLTESVGVNALRFGTNTPTSTSNPQNTNEIGSVLVLNAGSVLYLGNSLAANTGLSTNTDGSGMVLFGRDINGTAPGSNQYIIGGALDFGSREAMFVNESGNSALIRSEIRGTGGLTKAGANSVYIDSANTYSGVTNVAEGTLILRNDLALGDSHRVNIEGNGQLYLELGTNILGGATTAAPADLFIGAIDGSRSVLYSNSSNNTWGGDVIVDTVDGLGNWVYTPYLSVNALATLNLDGDIYSNELANPINRDTSLNDARQLQLVFNSAGGVINLNGQVSDNALGVGGNGAGITAETENQLLRVTISSSNEGVVNVRKQWNAAGRITVIQGILRYEGDGNFYTDDAAAAQLLDSTGQSNGSGQSGIRMGSGSNNTTNNVAIVLTKDGQVLNVPRIDSGGDGTNNGNGRGNLTLAGTNTSGTVTFGLGTDRFLFGTTNSTNAHVRDLSVYAASGGTVNLNFVLEDQDGDVHTSLTKIGRGTVNFNGGNLGTAARDGTVEQVTLSGGLLRLTDYGTHTGRRVDSGAMVVFAGGGIEMDGVGSIANETENLTGTAVTGSAAMPVGKTIVSAGATDVIVTSQTSRTTTLNIGSSGIELLRYAGGSLNFVQNNNGGSAVISFNGTGMAAGSGTAAFDSFIGGYATFTDTPGTVTSWAGVNSAFRVGAFTGLTPDAYGAGIHTDVVTGAIVGSRAQTLRFNVDGVDLDLIGGVFSVDGGGILATSNLTQTTAIQNGTLTRTGGGDIVLHNYSGGLFQVNAAIADDGAHAVALAFAGTGDTALSGTNSYSGGTFFNGGTVTISSDANLGAVPASADADNLYFNGGILHTTADIAISSNRGITLGGNGGEMNVDAGTTASVGLLSSEANLTTSYASNPAVGRFDKTGDGTLVLTALNNAHNGRTDIREGTLKWRPAATTAGGTFNVFGSTNGFLDGTILRSGATLDLEATTAANNSSATIYLQEWFTFEGGSRVDFSLFNDATNGFSDARYYFRGVVNFDALGQAGTPAGSTTFNVVRREVGFNDAGGYLTGDGGITKIGPGTLYFRESSPEWTGQFTLNEGIVDLYSGGNVLGSGTLPILLGHNLAAELSGEPDSGNSGAQLFIRDESGFANVVNVNQDVIVRADGGAGSQTKRIGARYLAHEDIANWNGTLTLNDNVELFYQDDTRNIADQFNASSSTAASNTRNDTRSLGAPTNAETVWVNFNGNIIGSKNLTINVAEGGNANVANGSITAPYDDLVLMPVFGLNGDNSAWTGNLIMGNSSSDVDRIHTVSIGSDKGISSANAVTMMNNAILQASGHNITIGSLTNPSGAATIGSYIENASLTAGSITIVQNNDVSAGISFRDGVIYGALQPGQSNAALSVVKAGSGALEMLAANSYTGSTTLSGGTLRLNYSTDDSKLSDTASLYLNDGILDLAGTAAHEEIVSNTVIDGTVAITRSSGASTLRLNALTRLSGTLFISENNLATTDTLNDATGIIGGWATVGGSWAVNATNSADGALVALTNFTDVNRLGGVIPDSALANVRIIEAGSGGAITLGGSGATTTINTLLQGANGGTATVDIEAGSVLRIASGGVLLPEGSSSLTLTGEGALTAGDGANAPGRLLMQNQDASALLTVAVGIEDNGGGAVGLTTSGPGTTVLTGANAYSGSTLVASGTLQVGDGGATGSLGAGNVMVNASGTLAFNRSDSSLMVSAPIGGEGKVLQTGAGRTTLGSAVATNALTFIMGNGTLATGTDLAINTSGSLVFGATYGAAAGGTLDLTSGSAVAGGLKVQTNSTAMNNIIIGSGKTLTINGNVIIGVDIELNTDSRLTISGATAGDGALVVNSPSGTFQVGGATGSINGNKAVLDMSDLGAFTANLGSGGAFRVGDNNGNSSGSGAAPSTVSLARNSTITAGVIGVGDRQGIAASVATLNLGGGTTVFNTDEFNVGDRGQRGTGVVQFAEATGNFKLRGFDGVSRTNFNMASSIAGTGYSMSATVDLSGHDADLYLNILDIARRTGGTGGITGTFSFDQGVLDVSSIYLGRKLGGTGTSVVKGTMNIGGGIVNIGSGGIYMAENSTTTASTASAILNFTGGDVTVGGDIIKGGATAPAIATATLNLTGTAVLDMQGHQIGSATQSIDVLTFDSGTLRNIGEINGGAGLATSGGGHTLFLDGDNTYTGGTTINAGVLQVSASGKTGFGAVIVNSGATLAGAGLIRGDTTVMSGGAVSAGTPGAPIGQLAWDAGLDATLQAGSSAVFTLGAAPGVSDQLTGTGTITLNADATLTVTGWDSAYTAADGDSWQLLDWTSISGDFDVGGNLRNSGAGGGDLVLPTLTDGYFWDVSSFMSSGVIMVVIPEPSRALLLVIGIGLLMRRRRPLRA